MWLPLKNVFCNQEIEPIQHQTRNIGGEVNQTVETVITFRPTSDNNAVEILTFLESKANKDYPDAIPDSWDTPDIRATISLGNLLENHAIAEKYKVVKTNIVTQDGGQLIVMRQEGELLKKGWRASPTLQNAKLVEYLANEKIVSP